MRRPHRLPFLAAALSTTFVLAACSSSDPTSSSSTGTTTGTGGTSGTGGSGGQGAGTFACKGEMCDVGKEVCDVDKFDQGSCSALPKSCAPNGDTKPTCACFMGLPPECGCLQDPNGNFVVQCTMTM